MDGQKRERRTMYCSKSGSNMGLCEESVSMQDEGLLGWKGVEQHWLTRVGSQLFAMLRGEACMAGAY